MKKFIILLASTVIAAFLGAFIASVAINGRYQRHHNQFDIMPLPPVDFANVMEQHHKMIEQQEEFFEKMNDLLNGSQRKFDIKKFLFVQIRTLKSRSF
jgi:hypothetical protein